MPSTAQTLVDEIVADHGIPSATALRYLDRRHKKMVARSKINRRVVAVGNTANGTSFYAFDPIEMLSFEVGGVPYGKARRPDIYGYAAGTLLWVGDGGLIVPNALADGTRGITIIPTPTSVQAITALAVVEAPDLALPASALLTPKDFDDHLIEGVTATVLAQKDEAEGAADRYEARFDNACEELRRRVARQFRGPGPAQIRVAGYNA